MCTPRPPGGGGEGPRTDGGEKITPIHPRAPAAPRSTCWPPWEHSGAQRLITYGSRIPFLLQGDVFSSTGWLWACMPFEGGAVADGGQEPGFNVFRVGCATSMPLQAPPLPIADGKLMDALRCSMTIGSARVAPSPGGAWLPAESPPGPAGPPKPPDSSAAAGRPLALPSDNCESRAMRDGSEQMRDGSGMSLMAIGA